MVSFVYTPVECLFYKFYGINCRPKSSAKLLDRFFHRRRQVSPAVKYLTHCFFDGCYHLLDGNLAVSFQHGLPLILGLPHTVAAGILCGQRISQNLSTRMGSSVPYHSSTTNTARGLAGFAGWAATTSWPPWLACVWLLI